MNQKFSIAYMYGTDVEKVLVANATDKAVKIKKGRAIAEFHCRSEESMRLGDQQQSKCQNQKQQKEQGAEGSKEERLEASKKEQGSEQKGSKERSESYHTSATKEGMSKVAPNTISLAKDQEEVKNGIINTALEPMCSVRTNQSHSFFHSRSSSSCSSSSCSSCSSGSSGSITNGVICICRQVQSGGEQTEKDKTTEKQCATEQATGCTELDWKERMKKGVSSNAILVRKDGKIRMVIDYRALNKVTVKDAYPMPKIQDITDALHGTKWFTGMDCVQAFHQIPKIERFNNVQRTSRRIVQVQIHANGIG